MIAVVSVEIQAANPSMPLFPWRAYVNSPSSLRIRNVPRRVGNWNIEKVYVSAAYPDGSIKSSECVLVGGIWVCTIAGSTVSGFSQNGYTIFADGKDENGNEVTGYCLGKGDITILEADGTITPGEDTYYVHMLSAEPTTPKDGDLWQLSGTWYIYQDGTSYPIGDDSGLIQQLSARVDDVEIALSSKADVSATVLNPIYGGNGKRFSDWVVVPDYGLLSVKWINDDDMGNGWFLWDTDAANYVSWEAKGNSQSTSLSWTESEADYTATATRTENPIIGYTLGAQTTKPLQPKLSDPQISAINSVVDERRTVVKFDNNEIRYYDVAGELTQAIRQGWETDVVSIVKEVKIGNSVTSIGNDAFYGCSGLTSVTIGNSVTSIGTWAFQNCTNLTRVTIPDSVTSIGDSAFQGCSSLPEITLPKGIQSIGAYAFGGTLTYFHLYLLEAFPQLVPSAANYPWGVANTANIITVRNATKEWVEEQAYGKGFVWRNATVNSRTHTCTVYAYNINALTISTAAPSFKVALNTTAYTTAREGYFALTLGNFTQPMTWDTPFDVFEGGSADAIAPKPNRTNIYYFFEYTSGHFSVSLFNCTYDALSDYVPYVTDVNGNKTAVTIGSRKSGSINGIGSFSIGARNVASGTGSMAVGEDLSAVGNSSIAVGVNCKAAESSFALGWNCQVDDDLAFAWNYDDFNDYSSHGIGTFNINPKDGLSGFYIGDTSLWSIIGDIETILNNL